MRGASVDGCKRAIIVDLSALRERVEAALRVDLEQMGPPSRLREACEYAVLSGGKRLRPMLVLCTAAALGKDDVMPVALSVEYFHTASLIADDLPCMDDDDMRRSRPSLHRVFGEGVALLASYTLIAAGYGGLCRDSGKRAGVVACGLEAVTRCAGLRGATHGQYLDLFPPRHDVETALQIIREKTTTLFEIALVLGWLYGGGEGGQLEAVRRSAQQLGMAFQIADDMDDAQQDARRGDSLNVVHLVGWARAREMFEAEMAGLERSWQELGLWTEPFQVFVASLRAMQGPLLALV